MKIIVTREIYEEDYTKGSLAVDGKYICDTIEDKVRELKSEKDKVYGRTAIPAGKYRVVIDYSNRFKKMMPHILNVPFFEGIRMHKGNSANDSCGCLIVCAYDKNGYGVNSKKCYDTLFSLINAAQNKGEEIFIEIK